MKKIIGKLVTRVPKKPVHREIGEALEAVVSVSEPVRVIARDPSYRVIESYYVYKPFVKVVIAETEEGPQYFVEEYGLTPEDKEALDKLTEILMDEIKPPSTPEQFKDLRKYVFKETERIVEKYKNKLGLVGARRLKLLYYIERNLLGFGPLDPLMRDPNIEDISCNGVGIPLYVWHRKYESIPTNITFVDEDHLNEFIMKLAHLAGKHISIAFPIVDAMLPGKHRLAATFGREVSVKGPTFTIRKFREKPFSVIELIKSGNLNSLLAAYLWTMIEHMKTAMIAGGTGVGKSFPGDTLIIAKVNGEPRILSAKELYDMVNSREYIIGDHIVKDVNDQDIEVLSIDKNYKLSWKKLVRVIKHRDLRPLVKLRTNTSIIVTTQDHNFVKIDPETLELIPVKASDLRVGDHIANVWLDIQYTSRQYEIDPDYAYLLGLWIGDGNIDQRGYIGFSNTDKEILERYKQLVRKYWSPKTYEIRDKRNSVINIRFKNKKVFEELKKLCGNEKSRDVKPPFAIIFSNNIDVPIAFLAGLLDSDGGICIEKNRKRRRERVVIEYSSKSLNLINTVSFILKRLRIIHHLKTRRVKNTVYYRVLVYDSSALKLLSTLSKYSIKAKRMKPIIENVTYSIENPNTNVFAVGKYLEKIRKTLGLGKKTVEKELGLSSRYIRQYEYGRRNISINNLRRFYEYYVSKVDGNKDAKKLLEKLHRFINGDIYSEKILSIEYVEPADEYLYDLEVEDTHVFVIGQIGWRLNHNTTLLNVISLFIKPGMKIVTVEDTPELNLPHSNWVQLTTRESYLVGTAGAGTTIRLFDLVKLSLRYRPDYIIVGEVRGEEAFVLFQALATGHGGLSTIHAETLDYAIKRLTSPPMNIPPTYMKLMNMFIHVSRVITRVEKGVVKVRRRVTTVQEVIDANKYATIAVWDPRTDSFKVDLDNSYHLRDIAEKRGWDFEDVIEEIHRKATVLNWMLYRNITDVWDVSRIIFNYYTDPMAVYKRALEELREAKNETVESGKETIEAGETLELGETTRELFGKTRELGK
ncbi:MAG: ATPase, T2SS/T4P/T4SS family [Thermoprotei archaeon]